MDRNATPELLSHLGQKARWVWEQTLLCHKRAPETRVASSLSSIEILVALYYGGILRHDPHDQYWDGRDRFVVSKGHGSIAMYPILADLGFFELAELERIGRPGSFLGGIPDPVIPGYETVNGSLGHGLGVACGMALALKRRESDARVFVLVGDGELYEGSNWEAIMFAGHHGLDNLTLIVDNNGISMLGHCADILDHAPLGAKLAAFRWDVTDTDGHDLTALHTVFSEFRARCGGQPKAVIAKTVKGRGVTELETNPLCHVLTLKPAVIDRLTGETDGEGGA